MIEKFTNSVNRDFMAACDRLAAHFCSTLGISASSDDVWWVSYGNVFAFQCGEMYTNAEDMMLVIEHRMTWEDYLEFYGQWIESEHHINLNSWLMGLRLEIVREVRDKAESETLTIKKIEQ